MKQNRQTYIDRIIHSALSIQGRIIGLVAYEKRLAGANRKARLIIDGESSKTYYFRWTGYKLVQEFDDLEIRNEITLHEDTFLDIVSGEVGVREAIAARLIKLGPPGFVIYDEEEILQVFEMLIEKIRSLIKL